MNKHSHFYQNIFLDFLKNSFSETAVIFLEKDHFEKKNTRIVIFIQRVIITGYKNNTPSRNFSLD